MLCNSASRYPNEIDKMIFFQDNNLEKIEIINHYNNLISQGKYTEANTYINQQEGVYGYFADFFNLLENKIYYLQEYLLTKEKKQPFIFYDEEDNYSIDSIKIFDDNDEEEDMSLIHLFTDNDEKQSIEDLVMFTSEEQEPHNVDKDTIWI